MPIEEGMCLCLQFPIYCDRELHLCMKIVGISEIGPDQIYSRVISFNST